MVCGVEGVALVNQFHSLKDIFEQGSDFVEKTVASIVAESEKRIKAKQPANDNAAKLSPGWMATLKGLAPTTKKPRFNITRYRDIKNQPVVKEYIVRGLLNAGEITEFVAKPGTAKSVLLADIGCHIAARMDWHGRKVKQGLVVFFAAERQALTERRIAAWAIKHKIEDIPFVVVGGPLNLTSNLGDANFLANTIAELSAEYDLPCSLVIIDTVTRTFGAGDQHQSRDMQRYIQSVDLLNRATTAHIALIHHSTWSEDRGKGAIDLDGAIDGSFGVTVKGTGPSKVFTLSGTGANDSSDEGPLMSFTLESVEVGTDTDGNPIFAPVVVHADVVPDFDVTKMKGSAAKALDSLERAIEAHGLCPPDGSIGFPDGVVTASRDQWREQYIADARAKEAQAKEPKVKATDDTLGRAFRRAAEELVDKSELVKTAGERCWIAHT
jgi:AAA domain